MIEPGEAAALAAAFPDAGELGRDLGEVGRTVAVAESCTGGLLGAALTAFPGSSRYVLGGVIAYADAVKTALLGVEGELLARHGAVSAAVAAAMAAGVRDHLGADYGVSITGVAGPGGEGEGKPAGLAFVAVATVGGTEVTRLDGDRGREANRARAVHEAIALCAAALHGRPAPGQ